MNRRRFLLRAGLLVLVLAFPAIVRAQRSPFSNPAFVGAMTRRATQSVLTEVFSSWPTTDTTRFGSSGTNMIGERIVSSFTPSGDKSIAKIEIRGRRSGSPTGTIRAGIFSYDSGGNVPLALVGGWSDTIDITTIGTSEATIAFTISSNLPTLTQGGTYYVVIDLSSSTETSGNEFLIRYMDTGTNQYVTKNASWSNVDGSITSAVKLYSYQ